MPYDEDWTWYPDPEPDDDEAYDSMCMCAQKEWEEENEIPPYYLEGGGMTDDQPHICYQCNCDFCPNGLCRHNVKEVDVCTDL